jgi:hypothetical protein
VALQVQPGWNLGYSVIFLLAVLYYSLGTYFIKHVDGIE